MTTLRTALMLARYSAWANARLLEYLASLPAEEIMAKRSDGAGSILKVLNHSRVVDRIWRAHLEGTDHGFKSRNTEILPTLRELAGDQKALDAWYVGYAGRLDEPAFAEVVEFMFVDGGSGAMTRGEILLHVANHKTYHRGYVAEMLYQAGLRPPVMDLPVFVRDAGTEEAQ